MSTTYSLHRSFENELFDSRSVQSIDSRTKKFINTIFTHLNSITSSKSGAEKIHSLITALKYIDDNFDIAVKNERFVKVLHDKMIGLHRQLKSYYNGSLALTKDCVRLMNRIHSRLHVMFGFEDCFDHYYQSALY
jgi:hypothetical protein